MLVLLSMSVVAASAGAESLGTTKVRVVAIDQGATLRISGWATIPASVANVRGRRFVVVFSLRGDGRTERFSAKLNHRDGFALTHATKLIGVLKLRARVRDAGRLVGITASKTVTVATPPSAGSPTGGGTTSLPGPPPGPSPTPEQPPTPRQPYVVPCLPATLLAPGGGMGLVTGGIYAVGGPAPGENVCEAGTVRVTTLSGEVVDTEQVGSTESYAIAVPAGTYLVNAVAARTIANGEPMTCVGNNDKAIPVLAGETKEVPIYCQIK
jgi:hypothetical protein